MTSPKTFKIALTAAIAAGLAIPTLASAQTYDSRSGTYYNACQRDTTNRQTTGALVGAGLGAVLGSQVAANKVRTEGSVLGGVLGAIAGAAIGQSSAACSTGSTQSRPTYGSTYGNSGYNYGYAPSSSYYSAAPSSGYYSLTPSNGYYSSSPAYSYGSNYGYSDGYYDQRSTSTTTYYYPDTPTRSAPRGEAACQMVDSPVRMPDGRTQTRLVKVCPDSQGRYQIVN